MVSASLKKIPFFSVISRIARRHKIDIWLVGGFLRDIYLCPKKKPVDFDFCVKKNTLSIVREFAKEISAKFIILDKTRACFRVILKRKGKIYTYDFTGMRGKSLNEDLSLRDFSVNTLAFSLLEPKAKLIDYFQACRDIKRRVIRIMGNKTIPQDPLRILRGFSFAANYGFRIEAETLKVMAKHKSLIKGVSKERINEELFKIFAAGNSYKTFMAMDKLRIIDEFIPEIKTMRGIRQGAYHHLGVWKHSLEALRQFELLCGRRLLKNEDVLAYLNEELAGGRSRLQTIKLACILHDIGKPLAKKKVNKKTIFHTHEKIGRALSIKIADNLRLSLREKDVLKKLIFWHLRPGYLADQINPTRRAIYRFFRDTNHEGAAVILLSLSDWRATRGPLTDTKKRRRHEKIMLELVDKYFREQKRKPLRKIIDGYDIMRKCKIAAGPLVGEVLGRIKEKQALGRVSTKQEALRLAKTIIDKVPEKTHFRPGSGSKAE